MTLRRFFPANLLTRSVVVEVILTTDSEGHTACAMSQLDKTAPLVTVVRGMFSAANELAQQAERLAQEHRIPLAIENGTLVVGNPE